MKWESALRGEGPIYYLGAADTGTLMGKDEEFVLRSRLGWEPAQGR